MARRAIAALDREGAVAIAATDGKLAAALRSHSCSGFVSMPFTAEEISRAMADLFDRPAG